MAKKAVTKKKKLWICLEVKHDSALGWTGPKFSFGTRLEAREWQKKHYPNAKAVRIYAARVPAKHKVEVAGVQYDEIPRDYYFRSLVTERAKNASK